MMRVNTVVKFLIFLTLLLFAFSLWQRTPDIDDAWIGEHAYWMAEKGYVKSELMHGITGQEIRHIVHHKVFTLNGALFIKLFGFSLMTLKSVSLLWLSIFLFVFIRFINKTLGSETAWFAVLLIIANALVFQYSFVFRPEIMVMTLGFLSYLYLEKSFSVEKGNIFLMVSGLFAGLSAATHLNGLIFMAAGLVLLLWRKNIVAAAIFSLSTLPAFALYFYDFTQQYGISYWLYQINDSPALHKSTFLPSSIAFIGKLFREHLRFFHSPKEISFTLLFLFTLILNYRNLSSDRNLIKYLMLLVVFLSLLAVHTTSKYILLYLPFIMLIIIRSFHFFYHNRTIPLPLKLGFNTKKAYRWSLVFLALYLAVNTVWNVGIATKKFDPEDNHQLVLKYMGKQQVNLKILAPMTFIFNEIENFNSIQSDLGLSEMNKTGSPIYGVRFLEYTDSLSIDYLIITDEYKHRLNIENLSPEDLKKNNYHISGYSTGLTILKREIF